MFVINRFTQNERNSMMLNLTEKQQDFLQNLLKRSRKTHFANILAKEKAGAAGNTEIAEQWEFIAYLDAGEDWRLESDLYCECGIKLRYQYIVKNKITNETKKFGSSHFEQHTGIPAELAREIKKGFDKIDYELDEILSKINAGWTLADEGIEVIPEAIDIAEDIQNHFDYQIPLLNRQVKRLENSLAAFYHEQAEAEGKKQFERIEAERLQKLKDEKQTIYLREQEIVQSDWWQYVKDDRKLSEAQQLGVIVYLKELAEPRFYISKVCEFLIHHYGATAERHGSGLYNILPDVGQFLQDLEDEGRIRFLKRVENMDRLYEVMDPFLQS